MKNKLRTDFSDAQFSLAYPDDIENNWWHLARNNIIRNSILSLELTNPVVLEVGCGRGITVKHLRDDNIDCRGVELGHVRPLATVAQYIHAGKDVCELSSSEKERVNVILLLDVIEHLPDPAVFMKTFVTEFPNLKNIIVTVPACQELWSNYDEYYGHYRRYSHEMLFELSKNIKCELIEWKYFFHSVYLAAWFMAKFKIKRQIKLIAPNKKSYLIHKLLSYVMVLECDLCHRTVPGTSLIGILQVNN